MDIQTVILIAIAGLGLFAIGLAARSYFGRRQAERMWAAAHFPKLKNLGTVKRLSILPLVDDQVAEAVPGFSMTSSHATQAITSA